MNVFVLGEVALRSTLWSTIIVYRLFFLLFVYPLYETNWCIPVKTGDFSIDYD